ncbi:MAG TPA: hypothetical protein VMV60_07440 [Thermoanaerobaculia bacterium]|nr:hypothetical protein [Thermoanaerobaculia bacterium]
MADDPKPPSPAPGTGAKPAPKIVGPVAPAIYTPGAKTASYRPPAGANEPLVTEGMKARQREIEKKRRSAVILRQIEDEEAELRWRMARRWIYRIVAILVVAAIYWKMQLTYHDRWPMLAVWIFLGTCLLAALSWMFWFLDYSD